MNMTLIEFLQMLDNSLNMFFSALLNLPVWLWIVLFVSAFAFKRMIAYIDYQRFRKREECHMKLQEKGD